MAGRVRVGAPDASLTPVSGVVAVAELVGRLGVVAALDDSVGSVDRSVATLRAAGATVRPRARGDVGYFAKDIAWAAVDNGCDFSLGVTRNKAAWRAAATIPDDAWRNAKRMKGA